jgi:hypothetical protein
MKSNVQFWTYLTKFFLELKIFRITLYRKSKHIFYSITFFRKSYRLWDNVEKYGRARQATDGDTAYALWMLDI